MLTDDASARKTVSLYFRKYISTTLLDTWNPKRLMIYNTTIIGIGISNSCVLFRNCSAVAINSILE